jgi:hypothetical protein
VWRSPDHLPGPDELAEPSRWLVRMAAAEIDAELQADGELQADADDDPEG